MLSEAWPSESRMVAAGVPRRCACDPWAWRSQWGESFFFSPAALAAAARICLMRSSLIATIRSSGSLPSARRWSSPEVRRPMRMVRGAVLAVERHVAALALRVGDELLAPELHEFRDAGPRAVECLDDGAGFEASVLARVDDAGVLGPIPQPQLNDPVVGGVGVREGGRRERPGGAARAQAAPAGQRGRGWVVLLSGRRFQRASSTSLAVFVGEARFRGAQLPRCRTQR